MTPSSFDIAHLISRSLLNKLSTEEQERLDRWRHASRRHEKLYQQILAHESQRLIARQSIDFVPEQGWLQFQEKQRRYLWRKKRNTVLRYAALLLVPLLLSVLIIKHTPQTTPHVIADSGTLPPIPDYTKAVLTLENGTSVELENPQSVHLSGRYGNAIRCDSAQICYEKSISSASAAPAPVFHEIYVPTGAEYKLQLADGTRVHLNAQSRLRYPVTFAGNDRTVELSGEGYFEVAPDKIPFFVKTERMTVEVLGTSFNVSAYPQEAQHTTLVSGSVQLYADSGKEYLLRPSQQASLLPDNGDLSVKIVDTSLFTSWIKGRISFKDEKLQTIFHTLSRWYDIEVSYTDPQIAEMEFGCNIDRYQEITPFLELLQKTGRLKIGVTGKHITIGRK